ncbi:MAG: MauE/DoxX family redox-associated membrane protein [Candidatus Saccharimonadales bacterium]
MDRDDPKHVMPETTAREYKKLLLVILGIFVLSALLTSWRGWSLRQFFNDFMAVFLMTFAAFKFYSFDMFVAAYQDYDIISKRFKLWAYGYPFLEAGLAFAYLLTDKSITLNVVTMAITGVALTGVWREVHPKQRRRGRFQGTCLGNLIRLPLSTVSFFENALMFTMATVMLFL